MKVFIGWLVVALAFLAGMGLFCTQMPGASWAGAMPAPTPDESDIADRLRDHVDTLARDIGVRGTHQANAMSRANDYVQEELSRAGYEVRSTFVDSKGGAGVNFDVTLPGSTQVGQHLVVGAHLDSARGSPGADGNASGVAALIELARLLEGQVFDRTVRLVVFTNGEPPHTGRESSGAGQYLRGMRDRRETVWGMISLDALGVYSDAPGSQDTPFPLSMCYPDTGNFVAFVGGLESRTLVAKSVETFRLATRFPCEGAALPGFIPGVMASDHAPFAEAGIRALMVTDTGSLRTDRYGTASDTSDRVDTTRLARVVTGLARVVSTLARRANIE